MRSSTPPTRACSVAAASTAPSTAPEAPRSWRSAGARWLQDRRCEGDDRGADAGPLGDPHGRAGLAGRGTGEAELLALGSPAVAGGRGRSRRPHGGIPGDLVRHLRLSGRARRTGRDRCGGGAARSVRARAVRVPRREPPRCVCRQPRRLCRSTPRCFARAARRAAPGGAAPRRRPARPRPPSRAP